MATARTYAPVPVPDVVFETIQEIRATGLVNMFDIDNVAEVADDFGDETQAWIRADRGRYMQLIIFGRADASTKPEHMPSPCGQDVNDPVRNGRAPRGGPARRGTADW
jgi:hypothetical protein